MCGIAGYFRIDGQPALSEELRAMADSMRRRGPDGEGIFMDGSLGLAHRRLSIIDLEGGAQPMTTADGALTVVFNGEIFNYRELRAELEKAGKFIFRTKSDTEVILALYRAEGEDFVRLLNGFFAFALYDRAKRKLILARDRFGVKPLFYFQDATRFAFASTLNALKTLPGFDRQAMSPESIAEFLSFQYIPGNRTVYENVYRLPPGSLMSVDLHEKDDLAFLRGRPAAPARTGNRRGGAPSECRRAAGRLPFRRTGFGHRLRRGGKTHEGAAGMLFHRICRSGLRRERAHPAKRRLHTVICESSDPAPYADGKSLRFPSSGRNGRGIW